MAERLTGAVWTLGRLTVSEFDGEEDVSWSAELMYGRRSWDGFGATPQEAIEELRGELEFFADLEEGEGA